MSKKVEVISLPKCAFCAQNGKEKDAKVDGATRLGPWANMCDTHFAVFGVGLGTGKGQELVLRDEE